MRFLKIMLLVFAVISGSTTAYAGQAPQPVTTGTELTGSRTWNFTAGKNRDLFSNMKGLMPGDTVDNTVVITNNSSHTVSFYLRVRPGQSSDMEAGPGEAAAAEDKKYQSGLLDTIAMEIWSEGGLLYRGNVSEAIVPLGQVERGRNRSIQIKITLPGEGMTNEYANTFSRIEWQFLAEGTDGGSSGNGGAILHDAPEVTQPAASRPVTDNSQLDLPETEPDPITAGYRGDGLVVEHILAEEAFPENYLTSNPEDMQIIVEDEPVPLAAFSDFVEPGILFHYMNLFLILVLCGMVLYYLLPFKRRRNHKRY